MLKASLCCISVLVPAIAWADQYAAIELSPDRQIATFVNESRIEVSGDLRSAWVVVIHNGLVVKDGVKSKTTLGEFDCKQGTLRIRHLASHDAEGTLIEDRAQSAFPFPVLSGTLEAKARDYVCKSQKDRLTDETVFLLDEGVRPKDAADHLFESRVGPMQTTNE